MNKLDDIDFYLVTYSSISKRDNISDVKNAVNAGCKIVQYREKNKNTREMINEAKNLKKICENKAIFLINDRVDVALAVDSDGVHLGQNDIPIETARKLLGKNKIIGLTVHSLDEAINAEKSGADYIGLAPIFKTDTKEDSGIPCGSDMIFKVKKKVRIPIVAVGGINKNNVKEVIFKGADSVVAVSAILDSKDVFNEVSGFIRIIKGAKTL